MYAEARTALAAAARLGRLDQDNLRPALRALVERYEELDLVEVSDALVRRAGALVEEHALRGYGSIHLAAATLAGDGDVVFVAGDGGLCAAAARLGFDVVHP